VEGLMKEIVPRGIQVRLLLTTLRAPRVFHGRVTVRALRG
jgi:hypothetical protein